MTVTLSTTGMPMMEPMAVPTAVATATAVAGPLPPISFVDRLTVAPLTLVFTPDDWNTPQAVTVSASAGWGYWFDRINYSLSSNDPNWNNAVQPPTTVFVNDGGGPVLPVVPLVPINTSNLSTNTKPVKTSTTLSAPASAVVGQDVTLTAHVRSPAAHAAPPTGSITFMDGKTAVGTADVANGIATLTVSTLDVGRHTLTAVFTSADSTDAGSTSAAVHTTNRKTATKTTLGVATSAPTAGAAPTVTLTAQVTVVAPGVAPVNGVVTFWDRGHVVGKANVTNGVATLTVTTLIHGKQRFSATYQATAETLASTSAPVIAAS